MRDTIDMAREVYGAHTEWSGAPLERLESLFALVRADERDGCILELERNADKTLEDIVAAIRNRGNT
jgi:hypothetical protein